MATDDLIQLFVRLALAIVCAGIATILVPRRIPGKVFGLVVLGIAGVFFGEWGFHLLRQRFGLDHAVLNWQLQGVPILPAVIGSAVLLYVVTMVMRWAKYE